jgi:transposase
MRSGGNRSPDSVVREIRRKFSSEEKIRVVLEGLKGEESISTICRREGITTGLYYRWSKHFLEAGKKLLKGDTQREANTTEVAALRKENAELKELVADLSLDNRTIALVHSSVSTGYVKEWESPDRLGFITDASRFTFGNDRYDMDGDGIPELVLSQDRYQPPQVDPRYSYRVYSTSTYALVWSYTPIFSSKDSEFFGFYNIDGDGLREAVFDDNGQLGGVMCVDWESDTVELELAYGYVNAVMDIDIDGYNELIVSCRDEITEVEHVEVWRGCTAGIRLEQVSTDPAAISSVRIKPNPAGSSVLLAYEIDAGDQAMLEISDVNGRLVRRIQAGHQAPGYHSLAWDGFADNGQHVAPGVYFINLKVGDQMVSNKVTLVR